MWRAIYRAGAAFRLRFGSGHSSARQRDKSRATFKSARNSYMRSIATQTASFFAP